MRTLIMSLAVMLSAVLAQAQLADSIAARMALQRYTFPQEKVHVMTDKPRYMAGDTIWLRAWVVDAATHQPVNASQFVYVELQNPLDTVVTRIKLRQRAGVFSGHIALSPEMAEGAYQLSAYTMFMQSVGEAYFFKRRLEVTSPLATRYAIRPQMQWDDDELYMTLRLEDRRDDSLCKYLRMDYTLDGEKWHRRTNGDGEARVRLKGKELQSPAILVAFDNYKKYLTLPRRGGDYDLSFYPEGGCLVPGQACTTTFKAMSSDGTNAVVTGRIVDNAGNEVATVDTQHDGMGLVRFVPQQGMTYTAYVADSTGLTKQFALPTVRPDATVLHLECSDDTMVTVRAVGANAERAIIVVQQRGNVLAVGQQEISLDPRQMPTGVVQALLLDDRWRRLSERLYFNRGAERGNMTVTTDKPSYAGREHVVASVTATDFAVPQGDYAVSVTDDRSVQLDSASAICVNLLLQSELQGRINNPEYYFVDGKAEHAAHLDLLMMTQGWRRYDVSQTLRGHLTEPQYPIELAQVVSGRVLSEWRKKPLQNAIVNLIAPGTGQAQLGTTDAEGRFSISLPNLPDGVQCVLQAQDIKGNRQMNVEIDQDKFPVVSKKEEPIVLKLHAQSEDDYIDAEQLRVSTIDGMRNILLEEVTISAFRRRPSADVFEQMAHRHFDEEMFEREGITTLEEVIRKIAGIRIVDDQIVSSRGPTTIYGEKYKPVAIFINGSEIGSSSNSSSIIASMNAESPGSLVKQNTTTNVSSTDINSQKDISLTRGSTAKDISYVGDLNYLSELCHYVQFQDVKRIEYITPNMAGVLGTRASYGGALWIVTKTGAEIAKSRSKNFYLHTTTPLGYQRPTEFYAPRYASGRDYGIEPGTDQRNTLYWNPSIRMGNDGQSAFDFYTNDDDNTTYTVTIEGVTAAGQLIHTRHTIKRQ